ncbi:hypothetical protein ACQJBY_043410 [Aegilops geniculata]
MLLNSCNFCANFLFCGEAQMFPNTRMMHDWAHYNGGTILALINQTAKRSDAATVRLQKLYCSNSALLALEPTIAKLDLLGDCQNKLMMHGSDVDCQVKNGGATRYSLHSSI